MISRDDGTLDGGRAGCRDALMRAGVAPDQAERWCAAWEAEAVRHGVVRGPYYWDAGRGWIDAQRAFWEAPVIVTIARAAPGATGPTRH